MNCNWYAIRRLRGALILILIGLCFFLREMDWIHFSVVPIFLIGLGVILLAERLMPLPPPPPPPPGPYPYPYGYPYAAPPATPAATPEHPAQQESAGDWNQP